VIAVDEPINEQVNEQVERAPAPVLRPYLESYTGYRMAGSRRAPTRGCRPGP
jgi:hypothetical protein